MPRSGAAIGGRSDRREEEEGEPVWRNGTGATPHREREERQKAEPARRAPAGGAARFRHERRAGESGRGRRHPLDARPGQS
jgi:hypothetical protein